MLLTNFISMARIDPDLKATGKARVLRELTRLALDEDPEKWGPAVEQVLARESTESTGIGRGIAVPHARIPGIEELVCAVGRVKQGLDFMAVDGKPVFLIFLICYPPTRQAAYLNFVATVAKLLRDEDRLAAILAAGSAEEMLQVMEEISAALVEPEKRLAREVEGAPGPLGADQAGADLLLLARLELCTEMLGTARSGQDEIKQRIEKISALVEPGVLQYYQRLKEVQAPALVPVEGGICQGCFRRLPSELAQVVRRESGRLHTCSYCNRFIYSV